MADRVCSPTSPVTTRASAVASVVRFVVERHRMPDLPPALSALRDLRDALIFGAASGLGLAARQRLVLQLSLQVRRRAVSALFPVADLGGGLMEAPPE